MASLITSFACAGICNLGYNLNMIRIYKNDIIRDGTKIGYIWGNDIYDMSNKKIGYYRANDVYDHEGMKIAYVDGSNIRMVGRATVIKVQENNDRVSGGDYSDVCRAAIRVLLGD